MTDFVERIRTRVIPAALTAMGVTFLAAGLLTYGDPVDANPLPTPTPAPIVTATTDPGLEVTPSPLITLPPIGTNGPPTTAPSVPSDRVATRIRIAALKIDLPVIKPGNPNLHPPCDVALYYENPSLRQPGEGRVTYVYAHAQPGMFLPLLTASKSQNGKRMLGMVIEIWTSDDQRFLYVITEVRRHVAYDQVFDDPFTTRKEQLWLQTSEGVGTQPKLQIVAEPLSQEASSGDAAHPTARPRVC